MFGGCPLPEGANGGGSEGMFWDTEVPDKCKLCIGAALLDPGMVTKTAYSVVPKDVDFHPVDTDRYISDGLKRCASNGSGRYAMRVVGIDQGGDNNGPELNRTTFRFTCENE